jgi:multisubunit Na+/H+ antiporter MnhF subunit
VWRDLLSRARDGGARQPFADLAIVLAALSFVGAVAFARFLEREL